MNSMNRFHFARVLLLFSIVSLPVAPAFTAIFFSIEHRVAMVFAILAAPWLYAWTYLLVCGLLSLPFQWAIQPGLLPRDLGDPAYRARRLYGLCWTSIYYNKPLYHLYLSSPLMKKCLFRLFGYRGQLEFTIYPDSWIRDLPLLDFGKGSYIGNRCCIGTNMAFRDGSILAGPIKIGDNCMIGHLAIVGLGTQMADNCELGVVAATGFAPSYGEGTLVSPAAIIGHNVQIGANTKVGQAAYVSNNCVIADGIKIPNGVRIKPKSEIRCDGDIEASLIS